LLMNRKIICVLYLICSGKALIPHIKKRIMNYYTNKPYYMKWCPFITLVNKDIKHYTKKHQHLFKGTDVFLFNCLVAYFILIFNLLASLVQDRFCISARLLCFFKYKVFCSLECYRFIIILCHISIGLIIFVLFIHDF